VAEHPSAAVEMRDLEVPVFYVDAVRVAAEEFPSDPTAGRTKRRSASSWRAKRSQPGSSCCRRRGKIFKTDRDSAFGSLRYCSQPDKLAKMNVRKLTKARWDEGSLCLPHDGDRDGAVRNADGRWTWASSGGGLRWRARYEGGGYCHRTVKGDHDGIEADRGVIRP